VPLRVPGGNDIHRPGKASECRLASWGIVQW
jgi:hypothetical protein